jgi:pilus assembly protein CpaD
MPSFRDFLVTLGALLLLGACAEPPEVDFRERYAVQVQPETVSWDAHFAGTADPFGGTNATGFDALTAGFLERGHGTFTVSARGSDGKADARTLAHLEMARVRLLAAGLPASAIRVQLAAAGASDTVTLSYTRYIALVPICGDWSAQGSFAPHNNPSPNFGCATQHNVGLLASDPAELAGMQPVSAPPDTENSHRVLDKYRTGASTAAIQSQLQTTGAAGIVGVGNSK